ncbi:hypothetical protein VVDAL7940_03066 [Vibrio vulnificus]|uniref:MarC family protein n=1 Tax=Vibrio vulnificus TaxID=672 RepID=UPI000928F622|nr:MarC family protein [Vibrio vulnificus]OJI33818.1 hypothetical protein VVDAL7940_03066 [Vibrio vulnificus]
MQTFEVAIFLQFFLGLVAAVNPVGIMPVFVSLTGHMTPEEKYKTALTANVAVAIILTVSLLAGQMLLDMFSISLDSFRVAGGLLLLSIAFSFCSWLLFRSAPIIVRFLGQTGINVITRIMGLILGALGIEFIANGLRNLFPGLA